MTTKTDSALRMLACCAAVIALGCPQAEEAAQRGLYVAEAFGAIPSDGIDDTAALQAAVDRVRVDGGGVLVLSRGTYRLAGTLELGGAHGLTIRGAGVGVTVLERAGDAPALQIGVATTRDQLLADLTLDEGAEVSDACAFRVLAPHAWVHSEMLRVRISGARSSICLDGYGIVRLNRLEIVTPEVMGAGIRVGIEAPQPMGANLSIVDSFIRGAALGVQIIDGDAVFMSNTDIASSSFAALAIVPSTRSDNHNFVGNYFDESGIASVLFGGNGSKSEITFTGNWIASSPVGVVFHDGGIYGRISFTGGRIFNSRGVGMDVRAHAIDLTVSAVQFTHAEGPCFKIHSTGPYSATLMGSTFGGCVGGVDVLVEPGTTRFLAHGNRGSGAIRCAAPLPAGAVNFFDGGSSGC